MTSSLKNMVSLTVNSYSSSSHIWQDEHSAEEKFSPTLSTQQNEFFPLPKHSAVKKEIRHELLLAN